jgi:hypothetical protein
MMVSASRSLNSPVFASSVRNLTFRDYDLKARGWLRSASGIQSLISLALLALSLLSPFGHRFE